MTKSKTQSGIYFRAYRRKEDGVAFIDIFQDREKIANASVMENFSIELTHDDVEGFVNSWLENR